MKLLSIIGTRPEAIKMAPVLVSLAAEPGVTSRICTTGQHREMLDHILPLFGLEPDHDLGLMQPDQTLNGLAGRAIGALDALLLAEQPDRILVHGDTTTALAAATAAFHRQIPVAHVEAGLRTYRLEAPFPEEMNRRQIDIIADLLFAPTDSARDNLEGERLAGRIVVTGNSGIDALRLVSERIMADAPLRAGLDAELGLGDPDRKLLLVTGHRRENFGGGFRGICAALAALAARADLDIVYPVHLNPAVRGPVHALLGNLPNLRLIPPLGFAAFVRLMQRADIILTDSGGIQEEAPSFGVPVLVMRDVTERPEGISEGRARLVGTDPARIIAEVERLLESGRERGAGGAAANPYGDGHAARRIVDILLDRPCQPFAPRPELAQPMPLWG